MAGTHLEHTLIPFQRQCLEHGSHERRLCSHLIVADRNRLIPVSALAVRRRDEPGSRHGGDRLQEALVADALRAHLLGKGLWARDGESLNLPGLKRSMLPQVEELATLVVCEDDDPTRELLCDHLTADRYRALPAPSASDALRLCGYNHPDLMVLDLGLPDASGMDVLREIRGSGERFDPELPILVLSGRASEADRLRGFEAGADDYLPKPFHYPELLARVAAVLRRRPEGAGARSGSET